MGGCFCKATNVSKATNVCNTTNISKYKNSVLKNDSNTTFNPLYIEEPMRKIKLNRKSKEEYYSDAIIFLQDLDAYLKEIV